MPEEGGAVEELYDNLNNADDAKVNQIIKGLLDTDDIETKTEIINVIPVTGLDLFAKYADKILTNSCTASDVRQCVEDWLYAFRVNMVSKDRGGRREVVEMVTGAKTDDSQNFARSLLDKALGSSRQ